MFIPSDHPHAVYSVHLTLISHLMTPGPPLKGQSPQPRPIQDVHAALTALSTLETLSIKSGHQQVTILAHLTRLRLLVSSGLWDQAETALRAAEDSLGLNYTPNSTRDPSSGSQSSDKTVKQLIEHPMFTDLPFERSMALHALLISVVYYTYAGNDAASTARLGHLHALMDNDALKGLETGIVEVSNVYFHCDFSLTELVDFIRQLPSTLCADDPFSNTTCPSISG
jgi:hypothetical protein